MPKRRQIFIVLACAVLVVGLYAVFSGPPEPSYKGRSLSSWIDCYNPYKPPCALEKLTQTNEALERIGTNALPCLLRWIHYEAPNWKAETYRVLVNRDLLRRPGFNMLKNWVAADAAKASCAADAILTLGPKKANTAIPELARCMNDAHAPETAQRAETVLRSLRRVEIMAATIAGITNASPTVSTMPQCLSAADPAMRQAATNALRKIAPEALANAPPR